MLSLVALFRFRQPSAAQLLSGNVGQVRLEIENGSPVEHVDTTNMQPRSLAADQFHDSESDRVGTPRRAGGKHSVGTIVGGRGSQQFEAPGAVEHPNHNQVRKALDVGQSDFVLRQNVEYAFGFMLAPRPFGICWVFWYGLRICPIGSGENMTEVYL